MSASLSPGNFGRDENDWFGGGDQEAEAAASKSLAATAARIVGAKPFPVAAKRLEELTRTSNARIEQVVLVLESDPALSARLLRLVNSAGYGLKVRCTSVRHAAVLVGTRRLNQVATTAAILDLFESSNALAAELLEHASIVGSLCRYLAVHLGLPHDELFTCGFLHDIGKIMLLDTERDIYPALLREFGGSADSVHEQERRVFGFDHATLGAHVLTAWNIPEPVPKVIAWHHQPARAMQDSLLSAMVQTLRLADLLAYELGRNQEQEGIQLVAASEAALYLDISEPQLASMWRDLSSLRDRSKARSHGEPDLEVADPRLEVPTSLRPRGSLSPRSLRASMAPTHGSIVPTDSDPPGSIRPSEENGKDLPKRLPCVVCGTGSYGNLCQACGGHVCPNHQEGADEWCSLCADDFIEFKTGYRLPPSALTATAAIVIVSLIGSVASAWSAGNTGLSALLAPLLLGVVWALVLPIASKLWVKLRFMRGLRPRVPPSQSIDTSGRRLQEEGGELLPSESQEGLPRVPSVIPDYDRSTMHTSVAPVIEPFAAGLAGLMQQATSSQPAARIESERTSSERAASEPPPSARGPMVIRVEVPSISPQALNARLEASLSSADNQLSAMARLMQSAPQHDDADERDHVSSVMPTAAAVSSSAEPSPPSVEPVVSSLPNPEPVASSPEPVTPSPEPVTPSTPSVAPVAASAEPVTPSAEPVTPSAEPVTPSTPSVAPVAASAAPAGPSVILSGPSVQPNEPLAPTPVSMVPSSEGPEIHVAVLSMPHLRAGTSITPSLLAAAGEGPGEPAEQHPSDASVADEGSGVRHVLLRNEPGVLHDACVRVVAYNRCS